MTNQKRAAEAILEHRAEWDTPRIIRSPEELTLCDRDDVFAVKWGVESWIGLATAVANGWPTEPFPAVRVAEGTYLRDCREALDKETE